MTDPIYSLRPGEALAALESSAQGITQEQAQQRQSLYGANELREPPAPLVPPLTHDNRNAGMPTGAKATRKGQLRTSTLLSSLSTWFTLLL